MSVIIMYVHDYMIITYEKSIEAVACKLSRCEYKAV